jgi:2-dehydro-3-deoxyphosphogalactonate aldolase
VLFDAGFRVLEVPLNSPDPFSSIERLAKTFGRDALIGAGTVIEPRDVDRVREAGGELIVMPHSDPAVIERARDRGLVCTPGVATPSEAFAALKHGADGLKMFPAENLPPIIIKAWRAVLPPATLLLAVGGIKPETMQAYLDAGADGFGLGSALFGPNLSTGEVGANARRFASAWNALRAKPAA